jgi:hypothetical protein
MISCDEVFDVLTRGPFPTGRPSDGVVEAHLCQCTECQRLAEALRPAVELFEAVAPEESRTLPSYGGRLRSTSAPLPWEATLAEALPANSKPELNHSRPPERQNLLATLLSGPCPVNLARFATAALLGAVVIGSAYQLSAPHLQSFAKQFRGAKSGSELVNAKGHPKVDVRDVFVFLPQNCLLPPPGVETEDSSVNGEESNLLQLASAGDQSTLIYNDKVCCTKCHTSDSKLLKLLSPALKRATPFVSQHCRICHPLEQTAQ